MEVLRRGGWRLVVAAERPVSGQHFRINFPTGPVQSGPVKLKFAAINALN
jgi:hypothetical protein